MLLVCACASPWERHEALLAKDAERGDYKHAAADVRWLSDHAFEEGTASDRTPEAEAARDLELARYAARAGDVSAAVNALRDALIADPHRAADVRAQLDALPVSKRERARLTQEFAWNIAALAPAEAGALADDNDTTECWSYRVHEVRVHRPHTVSVPGGTERRVTYDARPWSFDGASGGWRREGDWIPDAGSEIEPVDAPDHSRYRALTAAEHQFVTDQEIPPCHRAAWKGPFGPPGRVFTTPDLPHSAPLGSKDQPD